MGTFYKKLLTFCLFIFMYNALILQDVKAQTGSISIDKKNISLNEFLTEIRKQTGYDFVFSSSKLDLSKKVSPKFNHASITSVLDQYFNLKSGVVYLFKNETIVFLDEDMAQTVRLQGKVVNKLTKRPFPGVTVSVDAKGMQTKTDELGRFRLDAPEYAREISFNYVGYNRVNLKVQEDVVYLVDLEERAEGIEEVVVTGLFKRPEGNFTGAATSMKGEELKSINSSNVFAAVSAMDPSFRIVPNNLTGGNINQLPEVQLRGANSMPNLSGELSANPNSPLFILDGFEVNIQRVVDLDMNLIANITLLKDASATSIYGSRGANGVMVITTVLPAAGKVQVTLNNDFRLTTPDLSVYSMMNATEKLDFEKRAGVYSREIPREQFLYDIMYNDRLVAIESGVNTNWLKQPVRTAVSNRTSVYLQGGESNIRYGLQFSGDFQNGVMKGQDRKNYTGQFDLSYRVSNIRFQNSIRIFQNIANASPYGKFSDYVRQNPYWTPYDENGKIKPFLESVRADDYNTTKYSNPMFDATLHSLNKDQYFGFSNNFQVRYDILANLFLEANISINKQNGSLDQFYPAQHSKFANVKNVSEQGSYDVRNKDLYGYESRAMVNYNNLFGKHMLYSTLGFDIASNTESFYNVKTVGFAFEKLDNLLFATQYLPNSKPTGDESKINRIGLLLNNSYSYDNRYLADISVRRDGSSQFGSDKRFGTFWSTGIGWNIHNESFFKNNNYVNRLKARASYGSSGSINLPAYQAQTRYSFATSNIYNGELGAAIMGLGNNNLSWQDVRTLNLGTDITLLNESLDFRFEHYRSTTNNTITSITLASSTGFKSYAENLGKIQNIGYEIAGRYKLINNMQKGLIWSINAAAFSNQNKLMELSNQLKAVNDKINAASNQVLPTLMLTEGQSINTIYAVRSLGVDPATGAEVYLNVNGEKTMAWNAKDKVALGVTDPKWNGTFGTTFDYKGFNLNLLFDYRFGGQMYNQTLVDRVENVNPIYNADRRAYDLGWTTPGDQSLYTQMKVNKAFTRASSRFVQDENNLNLASASLSYNFYRHAFVKKMGFNSFQLTAITNDLVRWSSIQVERGIENPFARTYSLSIRANF